ncbi:isocitrate dehydrogenase kinase/phosphatase [Escherichia coli]|nr:isocitrate dehydrogenase kinase/phosphatase [Escherichia coli]
MPRGLELLIAQTILQGFDAQYGRFLEVTSGAQQRSNRPTGMLSSRR